MDAEIPDAVQIRRECAFSVAPAVTQRSVDRHDLNAYRSGLNCQ